MAACLKILTNVRGKVAAFPLLLAVLLALLPAALHKLTDTSSSAIALQCCFPMLLLEGGREAYLEVPSSDTTSHISLQLSHDLLILLVMKCLTW